MDAQEQRAVNTARDAAVAQQAELLQRLARLDALAAKITAKWERLERLATALNLIAPAVTSTGPNESPSA